MPLSQVAFVDHNNRLWVGASSWPEQRLWSPLWSVFDAEGVWLGDVRVPPRFRPLDSRDGRVLGVKSDENDVPHVQRWSLVTPS